MNKLRELIGEARYQKNDRDYSRVDNWLKFHTDAIANLIDAAQKCSLMSCGSVDECVANLHLLDAALKRLEM